MQPWVKILIDWYIGETNEFAISNLKYWEPINITWTKSDSSVNFVKG